jgi:hypothetical protein
LPTISSVMHARAVSHLLIVAWFAGGCDHPPDSATPEKDGSSSLADQGASDAVLDAQDPLDAGPLCPTSPEKRPAIAVTLADGTVESCDGLRRMSDKFERVFSGVVRDDQQNPAMRNAITIDTCSGGCDVVVAFTGSIPFAVPVGALVEVTYLFGLPFQCVQFLRISNLPQWNGQKNPVSDASNSYFIVSSGVDFPNRQLTSTGISVETVPIDCTFDGGGGPCGTNLRNYAYRFLHATAAPLTLMQGEQGTWSLRDQTFVVRNHRSFTIGVGGCDNWFDWGFSIAAR